MLGWHVYRPSAPSPLYINISVRFNPLSVSSWSCGPGLIVSVGYSNCHQPAHHGHLWIYNEEDVVFCSNLYFSLDETRVQLRLAPITIMQNKNYVLAL